MAKRLLIVGGVAGGMSAAARARRLDENARIIVFERGPSVSYANCGLPYFLGGEIATRDKLLVQTPERLGSALNLDVRIRSDVVAIHRDRKEIAVRDFEKGREYAEPYDALILSTGATPLLPRIAGVERPGHFALRTLEDMDAINDWIRDRHARQAVVAGGGFIGLEVAEQLHRRGLIVTLVERDPQVLRALDPEMAAHLHLELRKTGVALHLKNGLARLDEPGPNDRAGASIVVLADRTRLPADIVVLGLGVRPESKLAREAGLEIGPTGGVKVDEHLRTSDPAIYAVGECVEHNGQTFGLVAPLWEQARVCAARLAGDPHAAYLPPPVFTSLKITGIDVFSAGALVTADDCDDLVTLSDVGAGIYKKLILRGDRLVGSVLYGDVGDGSWYVDLLHSRCSVAAWRDHLIFGRAAAEPGFSADVPQKQAA
jgi:NAD(P)H-nitrite reductase large subunit